MEYYVQNYHYKICQEKMSSQRQNLQLKLFQLSPHSSHPFAFLFIIIFFIIIRLIMPKLNGKQVKDYIFGQCLVQFQQGSQVAKAIKNGKMNLTVYGIANKLIDPQTFPLYNNQIAENSHKLYPMYLQIVRSQNFIYLIFQQLKRPHINKTSKDQVQKLLNQLQNLLLTTPYKLYNQQIFMKTNGSLQLCIIVPYTKNLQKSTSNLYSKFHNKSILAQLFCQALQIKDKLKATQIFIENIQNKNILQKLTPYLNFPSSKKIQPHYQQNQPQKSQNQSTGTKSSFNKVMKIKQLEQQYPDIDEKQYEQLMNYVHVNPSLKKQAGQVFRQSIKAKTQADQNQITQIVNNVNTSIFKVTTIKQKNGKSKVQIKLNKKKLQISQFEVHFQTYYTIFKLFKLTIKSYLQKYKSGFAGIIAAYLLTLIGIIRRLRIYTDLSNGFDIFQIGGAVQTMNFQKYTDVIKKQLAKQARTLANLKNIIQNANMPYKTYEALMPFLDEDLESIDLDDTQNFCFFYLTVLLRMHKGKTYHQILSLQVLYILISPLYSIVYSEEDMPKYWDIKYYQLKKILISTLVPKWQI